MVSSSRRTGAAVVGRLGYMDDESVGRQGDIVRAYVEVYNDCARWVADILNRRLDRATAVAFTIGNTLPQDVEGLLSEIP